MNAHRNIFLHDGQVMIVIQYHKSIVITDQLKVIPQFLPQHVSQMLAIYLTHVLPFRKYINQDVNQGVSEEYLWSTCEKPWDTEDLSRVLKREFEERMDFGCTTVTWRHAAAALDREHVRCFVKEDEKDSDHLHDLQAAHSSRTAHQVYGVQGDMLKSLSSDSISHLQEVSTKWQRFLRVWEPTTIRDGKCKRKHAVMAQQGEGPAVSSLESQALTALQNVIGPQATFSNAEQEHVLKVILNSGNPARSLVMVSPTDGGKSLTFMGPASLPMAKTTVVILPFVALMEDMLRRCQFMGVPCAQWRPNQPRYIVNLVFVATENLFNFGKV
jgi:hypothetical protein